MTAAPAIGISIPGLRGYWREISAPYQYRQSPCVCPNCHGLGTPWHGWFTCEDCACVALVSSGRAFVLVEDGTEAL